MIRLGVRKNPLGILDSHIYLHTSILQNMVYKHIYIYINSIHIYIYIYIHTLPRWLVFFLNHPTEGDDDLYQDDR